MWLSCTLFATDYGVKLLFKDYFPFRLVSCRSGLLLAAQEIVTPQQEAWLPLTLSTRALKFHVLSVRHTQLMGLTCSHTAHAFPHVKCLLWSSPIAYNNIMMKLCYVLQAYMMTSSQSDLTIWWWSCTMIKVCLLSWTVRSKKHFRTKPALSREDFPHLNVSNLCSSI